MILADVQTDVDEETSNCSEVQEANPVEFDVGPHARAFGAVVPIWFDFYFANADLIVKYSIGSAVGGVRTTKIQSLGPWQFWQAPAIAGGAGVRACYAL